LNNQHLAQGKGNLVRGCLQEARRKIVSQGLISLREIRIFAHYDY
jgi:hypothetical protein